MVSILLQVQEVQEVIQFLVQSHLLAAVAEVQVQMLMVSMEAQAAVVVVQVVIMVVAVQEILHQFLHLKVITAETAAVKQAKIVLVAAAVVQAL